MDRFVLFNAEINYLSINGLQLQFSKKMESFRLHPNIVHV